MERGTQKKSENFPSTFDGEKRVLRFAQRRAQLAIDAKNGVLDSEPQRQVAIGRRRTNVVVFTSAAHVESVNGLVRWDGHSWNTKVYSKMIEKCGPTRKNL